MALTAGARRGVYEIVAPLGSGGMGEVYRARDTRLGRDVAIKILPPDVAADPERLARFEREAQVLASLNHPNIAHIHGVEDSTGTLALVMELVEGTTLADRTAKGPLPVDEALAIARQIAEGIEAAHEQGIIHRDLKPANIKVRDDGAVKILDFGLAKAFEPKQPSAVNATQSPTITTPAMMTGIGVILGTAAYMSPEQAKGRPADKRSDIWAFGCILYEMLAGRRAFAGDDVSDTLAAILRADPDWSALPADTPVAVRALLNRCLTKDRAHRLQAIGEARIAIDDALTTPAFGTAPPVRQGSRVAAAAGWMSAALMTAVAVIAVWNPFRTPPAPPHAIRFMMPLPLARTNGTVPAGGLAVSRDGSRIAFVGGSRRELFVRSMDQLEARVIQGTDGASFPSFSPDGLAITFIRSGRGGMNGLKRVSVSGGPVQNIADIAGTRPTQRWLSDDTIFYISNGALMSVPAQGGASRTIATPDARQGEQFFAEPDLLPDGTHALVTAYAQNQQAAMKSVVIDLRTGSRKTVLEHGGVTFFLPTGDPWGHLAFYDPPTSALMAVPFNWRQLEVRGAPAPVVERIQPSVTNPLGLVAVSASGTLLYVEGATAAESQPVWVDRRGKEEPLPVPVRPYSAGGRISPDGRRITLTIADPGEDVWVLDVARGALDRVTTDGHTGGAIWTPDGRDLIYERRPIGGAAVLRVPADRSGQPTVLATEVNEPIVPGAVTPDGRTLIGWYALVGKLWALRLDAPGARPTVIFDSASPLFNPALSPDGKWLAYRSDDTGRPQIYVSSFPDPRGRHLISTTVGMFPRWSSSGRELFYRNQRQVMAVDIETAPELRLGVPKLLFEGDYLNAYDVHPDGQRFLMLKPIAQQPIAGDQVNVVLNWFEELKQRVPVK